MKGTTSVAATRKVRLSLTALLAVLAVFALNWNDLSGIAGPSDTVGHIFSANLGPAETFPLTLNACESLAGGVIEVQGTGGSGTQPTGYSTLAAAFTAINNGVHTGAVSVEVCGNTNETAAPALLHSAGAGSASYSSVSIYPLIDAAVISGATPQGRGLIELNGADNVTINGDNPLTAGTNRNLTLQNTETAATTHVSVIRIAMNTTTVATADNCAFRNLNILGNTVGQNIGSVTGSGLSANVSYGIYAGGGAIGPTSAPNGGTAAAAGSGTTAANLTIQNNFVNNVGRGVAVNGSAQTVFPGLVVENNLIGNSTAGAVDQIYSMGITVQGSASAAVRSNTVYVESFLSAALRGIDIGSMSNSGAGAIFEKNRVLRVRNNRPQTSGAFGINLNGGNNHVVANNFVADVRNDQTTGGNTFTTTDGAFGIRVGNGTGHDILHNSVNLFGSVPGVIGQTLTAAFLINGPGNSGLDVRNNIFSNQLGGGNPTNTRHAAVCVPGGPGTSINILWNNNAYYTGTNANNLLAQEGTNPGTGEYLTANFNPASTSPASNFRSYTSTINGDGTNDNASFAVAGAPPFSSNTDLHVSVVTPLESGGANAGVGDDIDGQVRSVATPDIGADEFVGGPTDTTHPTITYTGLSNTTNTTNRTLTATIADNVAVASGAVLPRIYFRKNAGSYFSTQCILTSGNTQSGTYDCTINNSLIGGVTAGDAVGYFVIAQDTAGNVASNPAGAVATNVNTVTTPPTPNTYSIFQNFNGTFSVGAGESITSLTNNGGLFQQMNAGTISGNVTVNLTSDLTAETGTHSLNQLTETGVGGYTIFFQASGAPRTISGSSATALINLNGADRVTFSGLAFGPGGLTFRNNNGNTVFQFVNDASNNSILNCVVEGRAPVTQSVILIGAGTTAGNDNITISDSVIRNIDSQWPHNLIKNDSLSGTAANSAMIVANNQLSNFNHRAVWIVGAENSTVNGNTIFHTATTSQQIFGIAADVRGTNIFSGNTIRDIQSDTSVIGFSITGTSETTTVSANRIYSINGSSASNTGIAHFGSDPASTLTLVNNMVSLVTPAPSIGDARGIHDTSTAGTINVLHNSVYIGGTGVSALSYGFQRASVSATNVTLIGNLLFNGRSGSTNHYAVGDEGGSGSWTSNYNLYVGTASTAANFFSTAGGAVDFAAWKVGPPARDANSIAGVAGSGPFNINNMFLSPSDLHLNIAGNNPAVNSAAPGGVSTDFDGQARPFGAAPDIGADEVQTAPTAGEALIGGRVVTAEGRGIRNVRVLVTGGALTEPRVAITNAFGYFVVDGLRAGETYVVSVGGKRHVFDPPARVVVLGEDALDTNFIGETRP